MKMAVGVIYSVETINRLETLNSSDILKLDRFGCLFLKMCVYLLG